MKEPGLSHWLSPNNGATNASGFTGLPGIEAFGGSTGTFNGTLGWRGFFWYSTEYSGYTTSANYLWLNTDYTQVGAAQPEPKTSGLSARCVKD